MGADAEAVELTPSQVQACRNFARDREKAIELAKSLTWEKFAEQIGITPRAAMVAGGVVAFESLSMAEQLANDGMQRALEHAQSATPEWGNLARAFVKLYCTRNKGKRFTGREVVLAFKERGLMPPPNDKAFGPILKWAARAGIIRKVGTTKDPNRHGNMIPLWSTAP